MAGKQAGRKRRPSLLWGAMNRLTSKIYSFFVHGRVGDMISSRDTLYQKSLISKVFETRNGGDTTKSSEALMARSISSSVMSFVRAFLAALRLNVYGVFFAFYGLIAGIAYLIPAFMTGFTSFDEYAVITCGIIMLCSTPLLFSSQSAVTALSKSLFINRFILNVLCVPEERLKVKRQYGGTACVFIAAILGMALGGLSIFTHPLFVPIVMLCLTALFLVFAFPETEIGRSHV